MDKLPHTYGWYCTHGFLPGGKEYTNSIGTYGNAPSDRARSEVMSDNGIYNVVPNLENFLELVEVARAYRTEQEKEFVPFDPRVKPSLGEVLHWTLPTVLCDPTTDVEILKWGARDREFSTGVMDNPSLPEDVTREVLEGKEGPKLVFFALENPSLSPSLVDLCSRVTKHAQHLLYVINHPNVSRETLVRLSKSKFKTVTQSSLRVLVEKGWLKVE